MIQFFEDMAVNDLLWTGLLAGLLASVACGVIGPYVITRRIVFLAGGIAHVAVGGIGAAIFLAHRFPTAFGWLSPFLGALFAALGAAVILAVVHQRVAERMDTLIGALWATGMAAGILLIKFTPGYHTELMSYLFGSLSTVSRSQVLLMAGLNVVIVAVVVVFHKRLLAICLDRQQAHLQGVNVLAMDVLLLGLVAVTVVCVMQVVGLILVLALLTLPAATASQHVARLAAMMWVSTLLCALLTTLPRIAVYGTRISPEAAIILAAGLVYLISVVYTHRRTKV